MAHELLLLEGCTVFGDSNDDEKCLLLERFSVIKKIIFVSSVSFSSKLKCIETSPEPIFAQQ